jgi:hypothetical protein
MSVKEDKQKKEMNRNEHMSITEPLNSFWMTFTSAAVFSWDKEGEAMSK